MILMWALMRMKMWIASVLRHLADDRILVLSPFESSVKRRVREIVVDGGLIDAHVSQPDDSN